MQACALRARFGEQLPLAVLIWGGFGDSVLLQLLHKNQKAVPKVWWGIGVAATGEVQQNLSKIAPRCCRAQFGEGKPIQLHSRGPSSWPGKIIPHGASAVTCSRAEGQLQGEALRSKRCSPTIFWTTWSAFYGKSHFVAMEMLLAPQAVPWNSFSCVLFSSHLWVSWVIFSLKLLSHLH